MHGVGDGLRTFQSGTSPRPILQADTVKIVSRNLGWSTLAPKRWTVMWQPDDETNELSRITCDWLLGSPLRPGTHVESSAG